MFKAKWQKGYGSRKGYWYVTVNGKRKALKGSDGRLIRDKACDTATLGKAVERLTGHRNRNKNGTEELLVGSLVERKITEVYQACSRSHAKQTENNLRPFLRYAGGLPVSEIRPHHVIDYLQLNNITGAAAVRFQRAIKSVFNLAVNEGRITESPIKKLPSGTYRERITYFTPEQADQLLKASSADYKRFAWFLLNTGCRPSEAAALTRKHLEKSKDGQYRFCLKEHKAKRQGKTTANRYIYLSPDVAAKVLEIIRYHATGYLFTTSRGAKWDARKWSNRFKRAKAKLTKQGVDLDKDACTYSFRHTFATNKLGAGVSIELVAQLLGNSVQVCLRHYSHMEFLNNRLWNAAAA